MATLSFIDAQCQALLSIVSTLDRISSKDKLNSVSKIFINVFEKGWQNESKDFEMSPENPNPNHPLVSCNHTRKSIVGF